MTHTDQNSGRGWTPDEKTQRFLAGLFDTVFTAFCDGEWEVEVNDLIVDGATVAGLVEAVDFDPEQHDDPNGACVEGDPFYLITDAGRQVVNFARVLSRARNEQEEETHHGR